MPMPPIMPIGIGIGIIIMGIGIMPGMPPIMPIGIGMPIIGIDICGIGICGIGIAFIMRPMLVASVPTRKRTSEAPIAFLRRCGRPVSRTSSMTDVGVV